MGAVGLERTVAGIQAPGSSLGRPGCPDDKLEWSQCHGTQPGFPVPQPPFNFFSPSTFLHFAFCLNSMCNHKLDTLFSYGENHLTLLKNEYCNVHIS